MAELTINKIVDDIDYLMKELKVLRERIETLEGVEQESPVEVEHIRLKLKESEAWVRVQQQTMGEQTAALNRIAKEKQVLEKELAELSEARAIDQVVIKLGDKHLVDRDVKIDALNKELSVMQEKYRRVEIDCADLAEKLFDARRMGNPDSSAARAWDAKVKAEKEVENLKFLIVDFLTGSKSIRDLIQKVDWQLIEEKQND